MHRSICRTKKINSRGNFSFHRRKWEKDAKICGKQFSDVKHKKIYNSLVQRNFLPLPHIYFLTEEKQKANICEG